MRRRSGLSLGLALALLASPALPADAVQPTDPAGEAVYLGTYVWTGKDRAFGGFSGFDLAADGQSMIVISDRTLVMQGQLLRDPAGVVTGVEIRATDWLRSPDGQRLAGRRIDSEGLALDGHGGFYVSFEGVARVIHTQKFGGPGRLIEGPRDFSAFPGNEGLEALAVDADGTIYTVPEHAMLRLPGFPVYRYRNGTWDRRIEVRAEGTWLVVGADIGPDGRLYLLERDFKGLRGFLNRVRRFDLTKDAPQQGEVLFTTRPAQHDNLESIAVWRDASGRVRLTMISDDNFRFLQQTQIVDYRLAE